MPRDWVVFVLFVMIGLVSNVANVFSKSVVNLARIFL